MKNLKESLYDIISPTREIAEGILNIDDVEAGIDDSIARSNKELIKALTSLNQVEADVKGGTLYIKCGNNRQAGLSTYYKADMSALMNNNTIKHIVCDGRYYFRGWEIGILKNAGIESITAPVIHVLGRCDFDCSELNEIKLVADSFILSAYGESGKNSKIRNLNLKCKKNIKLISEAESWGDDLFLENITVDCNKVLLLSRKNFNTTFRGNPWKSRTFSGMGFTPQSKFKQIDCFDDQDNPDECIRYSKKKPKDWNDNPDSHERKYYCWEMEDRPGWYCDTKVKPTKAMIKI